MRRAETDVGVQPALHTSRALEKELASRLQDLNTNRWYAQHRNPAQIDDERKAIVLLRHKLSDLERRLDRFQTIDGSEVEEKAEAMTSIDTARRDLLAAARECDPYVYAGKDVLKKILDFCELQHAAYQEVVTPRQFQVDWRVARRASQFGMDHSWSQQDQRPKQDRQLSQQVPPKSKPSVGPGAAIMSSFTPPTVAPTAQLHEPVPAKLPPIRTSDNNIVSRLRQRVVPPDSQQNPKQQQLPPKHQASGSLHHHLDGVERAARMQAGTQEPVRKEDDYVQEERDEDVHQEDDEEEEAEQYMDMHAHLRVSDDQLSSTDDHADTPRHSMHMPGISVNMTQDSSMCNMDSMGNMGGAVCLRSSPHHLVSPNWLFGSLDGDDMEVSTEDPLRMLRKQSGVLNLLHSQDFSMRNPNAQPQDDTPTMPPAQKPRTRQPTTPVHPRVPQDQCSQPASPLHRGSNQAPHHHTQPPPQLHNSRPASPTRRPSQPPSPAPAHHNQPQSQVDSSVYANIRGGCFQRAAEAQPPAPRAAERPQAISEPQSPMAQGHPPISPSPQTQRWQPPRTYIDNEVMRRNTVDGSNRGGRGAAAAGAAVRRNTRSAEGVEAKKKAGEGVLPPHVMAALPAMHSLGLTGAREIHVEGSTMSAVSEGSDLVEGSASEYARRQSRGRRRGLGLGRLVGRLVATTGAVLGVAAATGVAAFAAAAVNTGLSELDIKQSGGRRRRAHRESGKATLPPPPYLPALPCPNPMMGRG